MFVPEIKSIFNVLHRWRKKNIIEFSLDVSETKSTHDDFARESCTISATPWKLSGIGERTKR